MCFCKLHDGSFIYLLLYDGNIQIASKRKMEIEILKTRLNKKFEMKRNILGTEICKGRSNAKASLTQAILKETSTKWHD